MGREHLIRKTVVPAAGLGTRLMSATKEQPKEMLPLFAASEQGAMCLKPIVQQIFEQLFDFGLREFYFIVGRGKRAIEDHFAPDHRFVDRLNTLGKGRQVLEAFYRRIEESCIIWVNQPEPKGFGAAVLQAEPLVDGQSFLVHAGDTCIISGTQPILERLMLAHATGEAEATLAIQEVPDPRQYGVAEVRASGEGLFHVKAVVEKPAEPKSGLAIMPLYIFNPPIFGAVRATPPGDRGEIELTDAIQNMIDNGMRVQAVKLLEDDIRLDIGTPESYWEALELSHRYACERAPFMAKRNP